MYIYMKIASGNEIWEYTDRIIALWYDYTVEQYNDLSHEYWEKEVNEQLRPTLHGPWIIEEMSLTPIHPWTK